MSTRRRAPFPYSGKPLYEKAYIAWNSLKQRCRKNTGYWKDVHHEFPTFQSFLDAVGLPPANTKRWSIDRIDNKGHYVPGNVRWATPETQARNRNHVKKLRYEGEMLYRSEIAKRMNISVGLLNWRLANWPVERALSDKRKVEKHRYEGALRSVQEIADLAGVSRRSLYNRIHRFGESAQQAVKHLTHL